MRENRPPRPQSQPATGALYSVAESDAFGQGKASVTTGILCPAKQCMTCTLSGRVLRDRVTKTAVPFGNCGKRNSALVRNKNRWTPAAHDWRNWTLFFQRPIFGPEAARSIATLKSRQEIAMSVANRTAASHIRSTILNLAEATL